MPALSTAAGTWGTTFSPRAWPGSINCCNWATRDAAAAVRASPFERPLPEAWTIGPSGGNRQETSIVNRGRCAGPVRVSPP
ncbi:hypothetical protein VSR01_27560 [Actinacidiphila sp. DG2A-62]|nr:hypothetical protein [Actinacidiphila sp. DG2A-62]MEC3997059.1 hypothetical protein [Actinacidiphila sp. DG2A-62]